MAAESTDKIHGTPTYEISIYYFQFMDRRVVTYHYYRTDDISARVQRQSVPYPHCTATVTAL